MVDCCHFKKSLFGHNSAANCLISVKFYMGEAVFHKISAMGQTSVIHKTSFCFPNAVWASAMTAFVSSPIHLFTVHLKAN